MTWRCEKTTRSLKSHDEEPQKENVATTTCKSNCRSCKTAGTSQAWSRPVAPRNYISLACRPGSRLTAQICATAFYAHVETMSANVSEAGLMINNWTRKRSTNASSVCVPHGIAYWSNIVNSEVSGQGEMMYKASLDGRHVCLFVLRYKILAVLRMARGMQWLDDCYYGHLC